MNRRTDISEAGMTIVEMVVVLGLFALILTAFLTLVDKHYQVYRYENALIAANGSARSVLTELELQGLQARRVLQSQVINGSTYTSSASTLVLQEPSVDSSGNIISNTYDYIAFYTSGTQILEQTQAGTGSRRYTGLKQLSNSLKTLTFTYDSATWSAVKTVSVDLTTEAKYQAALKVSTHLKAQLRLRNY